MPNWVKNRITIECSDDQFKEIIDQFFTEVEDKSEWYYLEYAPVSIDFNKLIPMPEYIYQGNLGKEEIEKYGKNNWYDWSIENWGTKWNARDSIIDYENKEITFDTAWSPPIPIIEKLTQLFPYRMLYICANEDIGSTVYKEEFFNGLLNDYCIIDYSDEAYEIAFELWGYEDCYHKTPEGIWEHYDCMACPHDCFDFKTDPMDEGIKDTIKEEQ
jgi:hypothetical protein